MLILSKIREVIVSSPMKRNKVIIALIALSLIINIGSWLVIVILFGGVNHYIILGYTIYFGITLIGPWYQLLWLPAFGAFTIVVNNSLGFNWYVRERLVSYGLAIVGLAVNIILLVGLAFLIYLNNFNR